ncbi:MAG TPA: STAS domain-containing protein [Solirubrobacteraceae bacterium]|nr:STAS domain-containing protein [Solirubrobacteraceae bacterium]
MSAELSITLAVHDGALVLRPSGQLDIEGAPILKRALQHVDPEARTIVIDLAEVTFIDSTALSVLIGFQQQLPPSGVLRLRNLTPAARRLLDLTGLDRTFRVDDEWTPLGRPLVVWRSEPEADVVAHGRASGATLTGETAACELSEDAATVVGLVMTAMPFANGPADQAERWLRALARNGDAGFVLDAAGVGDPPGALEVPLTTSARPALAPDADPVEAVTAYASRAARSRGEVMTRSTDLLEAVRDLYGDVFTEVLRRHSADPGAALEHLGQLLGGR